jgi:hypothetical protein
MKTKQLLTVILFAVTLSVNALIEFDNNSQNIETYTVIGTYDGYDEEDGYSFIVTDEYREEKVMYFTEITDEALKVVNLKSKDMLGKQFEITYEIEEFEEVDEDGNTETYEKHKIVKLVKK